MDILFIVPYVPNLIRVRSYNLIRYLTQRGNRVSVMTLYSGESERQSAEDLRAQCHAVTALPLQKWRSGLNSLLTLPSGVPLQANYCWQPELAKQIEAAVWPAEMRGSAAFDVVHIEHLRGARYGLHLLACFGKKNADGHPRKPVPIVWDSVDSITHLFRQSSTSSKKLSSRLITRFELGRTEKHEALLAGTFDRTLVTSKIDRDAFLGLPKLRQPPPDIQVLPNGADLSYFQPDESIERAPKTLVISGKMSYHANISMVLYFVNRILPGVRERHPEVKLIIVGKDPPRDILALALDANIEVTGTVSDIRPYLCAATIAAAPLTYGAGIQNKILEAMACGTPVVTTTHAVSSLAVTPGADLLAAVDEADFVQKTCLLLENDALRAEIGRNGLNYVQRYHRWSEIAGLLESYYKAVMC